MAKGSTIYDSNGHVTNGYDDINMHVHSFFNILEESDSESSLQVCCTTMIFAFLTRRITNDVEFRISFRKTIISNKI